MQTSNKAVAGRSRYEWTMTIVLGLAFGIVFFDRNALNFMIPFVIKDIALSNTQIGAIASGLALSWCISGFVIGRVSDRLGRQKPLLIAAVVFFSLASFATGLAASFGMIVAARLLMGLSEGPVLPLSQSLMTKASSPENRGANMGVMQNVFSNLMGSLVAPLVLVAVASAWGWRSAFFLTAIPGMAAAFLIWYFIVDKPTDVARSDAAPLRASVAIGATSPLGNRNVVLCVLISALMVSWMITGWVFLPVYFTTVSGFDPVEMSVLMSALGVTGAVAGFFLPALSDRLGRRPVMIFGCLLGVLTPAAALFQPAPAVLLLVFVATGWMAGGTFSLFMATIPCESVPAASITTALALCMGMGELVGGAVAPAVAGMLADVYGLVAPLYIQIISALLAGVLSLVLIETAPAIAHSRSNKKDSTGYRYR